MTDIAVYLADFLQAQIDPQKPFKWFFRLKAFFESRFGKGWLEKYRELRDKYGPFYDDSIETAATSAGYDLRHQMRRFVETVQIVGRQ